MVTSRHPSPNSTLRPGFQQPSMRHTRRLYSSYGAGMMKAAERWHGMHSPSYYALSGHFRYSSSAVPWPRCIMILIFYLH
ncbi:Uncharacterized protein HZ326_21064 [Fusarium oxysporum f. sp. albedinis]|nr:Uncharacterized protein HZ326_21064 [Fusarium oxysporum f. sp. albedinis]